MAFVPYSYDDGQPLPFEYYKLAAAGSLKIGLCMALEEGALSAADEPQYICMREEEAAAAGTVVPVIRISDKVVFEAPLAGAAPALAAGAMADVSADGLSIDPAGEIQNIQIVDMDGSAAGDKCRCRFMA